MDTSRPTAARHILALIVVAVILVVHSAGRVGAYCSPLQNDSYIYTAFGYRIAHGDVLYRDMSDIKPPGLFMLYALVYRISSAGRAAVAPMESAFLLLAYYVVYRVAAAMYGRSIGLLVALAAAIAVNYFGVTGHVIEGFGLAENFMVLPAAAAFLFYRNALVTGRMSQFVWCGLMLGLDASIKQTALPLIACIAVHGVSRLVLSRQDARHWFRSVRFLALGFAIAWTPFVAVMLVQGTLGDAARLLLVEAGTMVTRGNAWPSMLRDVQPLWLPLLCMAWGGASWLERAVRGRRCEPSHTRSASDPGVGVLVLWCIFEAMMLLYLPLRSAHYYTASCLPFVLLFGAPLAAAARRMQNDSPAVRAALKSAAVVVVTVFFGPSVERIVPTAIARHKAYDWQADREYFDESVNRGPIHYGRGPARVGPLWPTPGDH